MKNRVYVVCLIFSILWLINPAAANNEDYPFKRLWPQNEHFWLFNEPSDVAVDHQRGFVYVSEVRGLITKFTRNGDFVTQWKTAEKISSITVDQNGYVYAAHLEGIEHIQKFDGEGRIIQDVFLKLEKHFGTDIYLYYIRGLAVAPNGHIYLISAGPMGLETRHLVWYFDQKGEWLGSWGEPGVEPGKIGLDVERPYIGPHDIAIDGSNRVYIADTQNDRIQVFSLEGKFQYSWGAEGSESGQFHHLTAIAVDQQDRIYAADNDWRNNRVQRFSMEGEFIDDFYMPQAGDNFNPTGMIVNNESEILIADFRNRIYKIKLESKEINSIWQSASDQQGAFDFPYGIDTDRFGNVYVVDAGNKRIQIFNEQGQFLSLWQHWDYVFGRGRLDSPETIAIGKDVVFLKDSANGQRIILFDIEGRYITTWQDQFTEFGIIRGIAADGESTVYVSATHYFEDNVMVNSVIKLDLSGQIIHSWQWQAGINDHPVRGLAIAKSGILYAVAQHKIMAFDSSSGNLLLEWPVAGYLEETGKPLYSAPPDVAVDDNGLIYTLHNGGTSIRVFNDNGERVAEFSRRGTKNGEIQGPAALTIKKNKLYISDSLNNRIQQFEITALNDSSGEETPKRNKAIIVAGGGPSTETRFNAIWDSTLLLTNRAYFALRGQGFEKQEIKYLTAGSQAIDLDSNGILDDLEYADLAGLEQAITKWAADAQDVVLLLADHGGFGIFALNEDELLTRERLIQWVDRLDEQVPGKITIIIEACQSASFFEGLAGKDRHLIASAKADQPAIISNMGYNSFSYFFWSEIRFGKWLQQAFRTGRQAMSSQTVLVKGKFEQQNAQLDSDGLEGFSIDDYTVLGNYCLGPDGCLAYASDEPVVQSLTASDQLQGQQQADFKIEVTHLSSLDEAWALISRPDNLHVDVDEPVTNLQRIKLDCQSLEAGQSQCQGSYDDFGAQGDYHVTFYALDKNKRMNAPESTISLSQMQGAYASYNHNEGTLILQDLDYGGLHLWVKLKDTGGFQFELDQFYLLPEALPSSIVFDQQENQIQLPKVSAFGQYFSVLLKIDETGKISVADAAPYQ